MEPGRKMRIHLLVPDDAGPIHSGPADLIVTRSTAGRWRCACDGSITLGKLDRGTGEPWAVRCNACKATAAFRQVDRPKPGSLGGPEDLTADGT